jgi:hypothetical protein
MLKATGMTNSSQHGNKPKRGILQLMLTFGHHLISISHIRSARKKPGRIKNETDNSYKQEQGVLPTATLQLHLPA